MEIKDAIHWIDIVRMGYICDPNECVFEKDGDPCKAFHCDEIHDALVMAMDALKKHTPKKPKQLKGYEEYICPECSALVGYEEFNYSGIDEIYHGYCPNCGQAIDWSNEE